MKLIELLKETDEMIHTNPSSRKTILSKQTEICNFFGNSTNIKEIATHDSIVSYINYLKYDLQNQLSTINCKLAYLKCILNYAHRVGKLNNVPYIPTFKVLNKKEKYLSEDEERMMLDYCIANNDIEMYKVIVIGLNVGLRISELLAMTDKDINFETEYYNSYKNKSNKITSLPLNSKAMGVLEDFTTFKSNYRQIEYRFKKMVTNLNMDSDITIHTLRHTFCSRLVEKGVTLPVVQELANHKDIKTTRKYTHVKNETLEKAVNLL